MTQSVGTPWSSLSFIGGLALLVRGVATGVRGSHPLWPELGLGCPKGNTKWQS